MARIGELSGRKYGVGDGPPDTANADADADFATTLIGMLVNARLAAFNGSAWIALSSGGLTTINSEGQASNYWLRAASALFGRDTSDSTMRAIEAATSTSSPKTTGYYRLLVDSAERACDTVSGNWYPLYTDAPIAVVDGRALSSVYATWGLTLDCKRDAAAASMVPTQMERTAQGSAVNPAAAVIATLDARGLTNKSFSVTDTAVGTYSVEFSYDGVTYVAPAEFTGIATIVGTLMASNRAIEVMKGFRYVRIKATEAAGTVTVQMSAMGA